MQMTVRNAIAIRPPARLDFEFGRRARTNRSSHLKRVFDISVSTALLMVLLPAILLIATLINLEGPGPVIYTQPRVGLNRRVFSIYKFRTMRPNGDDSEFVQAAENDKRVTRLGRLLRRTSLDELPQLINVIRGDMSLVGPRPHPVPLDTALHVISERYWDRYSVRPGMTGLAQVKGYRGPTQALQSARMRLAYDLIYIRRWSMWMDLKILAMTPFKIFGPTAF